MRTNIYLFVMTSVVSFSVFSAENTELNNDQLLQASCQTLTNTPEHVNAKHCAYFIQGLLTAAESIDPPVIKKQTKKERKFYGFTGRTFRTKEQTPPRRFFPFCVPDNESITHVIKVISKQLPAQFDTGKRLKDTVFNALEAEYPCVK
jgi:hypothetical protein